MELTVRPQPATQNPNFGSSTKLRKICRKKFQKNAYSTWLCEFVYNILCIIILCSTSNYMFKVNNRNARTRCEICSELTIKTPTAFYSVSIVNFEQVNTGWFAYPFQTNVLFLYPQKSPTSPENISGGAGI